MPHKVFQFIIVILRFLSHKFLNFVDRAETCSKEDVLEGVCTFENFPQTFFQGKVSPLTGNDQYIFTRFDDILLLFYK